MKLVKFASVVLVIAASVVLGGSPFAQDLGPRVKKLADGVYVHTGKGFDSNSGIIITDEGVIVDRHRTERDRVAFGHGGGEEADLAAGTHRDRHRTA